MSDEQRFTFVPGFRRRYPSIRDRHSERTVFSSSRCSRFELERVAATLNEQYGDVTPDKAKALATALAASERAGRGL